MEFTYEVSVLVATYYPDLNKILNTLYMIMRQRSCNFEIIITDDGSECDYFTQIEAYFIEKQFKDYKLIKNNTNVGTVRNIYNALMSSSGKYVYCTSPGDYLYDDMTLHDFVNYAKQCNADLVFGDAVYYSVENNQNIKFHEVQNNPPYPDVYNNKSNAFKKTIFFMGNYILGAALLREHMVFKMYLEKILDVCKYVEDNTTIAYMLIEDKNICYYKRLFIYYEYGDGVSTSKSEKWKLMLKNDFNNCYKQIAVEYANKKNISKLCELKYRNYKVIRKALLFLTTPMFLKVKLYKLLRKKCKTICCENCKTNMLEIQDNLRMIKQSN
ncbi:glycosyltransferase [Ruminococcus flavefaciens]|uniref:glycosyltransferase n=1 Tax=Ruminococcus flavefaciens TaxID=1265 RepID=UPI00048F733E|nr:glycosyltransferase family 2 protein [Ruminococcus flavefaciens]